MGEGVDRGQQVLSTAEGLQVEGAEIWPLTVWFGATPTHRKGAPPCNLHKGNLWACAGWSSSSYTPSLLTSYSEGF